MLKQVAEALLSKVGTILEKMDANDTGLDDNIGKALEAASNLLKLSETPSLETIKHVVKIVSEILENLDENTEGLDDFVAFLFHKVFEILVYYESRDYKTVILITLEIAAYILENIDEDKIELDDKVAKYLNEIHDILE